MKKLMCAILSGLLILSLAACSKEQTDTSIQNSEQTVAETTENKKSGEITIQDIDWSVDEAMVNDSKRAVFSYTNNSNYTITSVQIRAYLKSDYTKEDVADWGEDLGRGDEWELSDIFLDAEYKETVEPNETSPKEPIHRNNIYYVNSTADFEKTEPALMTIKYLDSENTEQSIYYDYKAGKYLEDAS